MQIVFQYMYPHLIFLRLQHILRKVEKCVCGHTCLKITKHSKFFVKIYGLSSQQPPLPIHFLLQNPDFKEIKNYFKSFQHLSLSILHPLDSKHQYRIFLKFQIFPTTFWIQNQHSMLKTMLQILYKEILFFFKPKKSRFFFQYLVFSF